MESLATRRQFLRCLIGGCLASALNERSTSQPSNVQMSEPSEALFYKPLLDGRIECLLESRRCVIYEGERGYCGVKENRGGKLFSLVYGLAAVVEVEPLRRHYLFHVLPQAMFLSVGTVGCNMHCRYCETAPLSQAAIGEVATQPLDHWQLCRLAQDKGCQGLVFAYNEPVVAYEYVLFASKFAKEQGLRTACHTAARIHEEPLRRLCQYLDAINIDLKCFNESTYVDLCQGDFEAVKKAIVMVAKRTQTFLEVTYLLVPGYNDDEEQVRRMCGWLVENVGDEVPLHFVRFFPAYQMKDKEATPVETVLARRELAQRAGLKYVYSGNLPGHPSGFSYCHNCKALLIERDTSLVSIVHLSLTKGRCEKCGNKVPGVWR